LKERQAETTAANLGRKQGISERLQCPRVVTSPAKLREQRLEMFSIVMSCRFSNHAFGFVGLASFLLGFYASCKAEQPADDNPAVLPSLT
jgi:hypothetical protein